MSAGRFTRSRYQATSGNIHPIRIQPETVTLTIAGVPNDPVADPVTPGVPSAKVSLGRRGLGVRPAQVSVAWLPGEAPTGYVDEATLRLPLLSANIQAQATIGASGEYLNGQVVVVGFSPESVR